MSRYRRWRIDGAAYFFTIVTLDRRPILATPAALRCLRRAVSSVRCRLPFALDAYVLLPDHLHCVVTLPPADCDFATRIRQIKSLFVRDYLALGGVESATTASRTARGERGIWQRRFFEHLIRDENDLKRCVAYVHVNPVKHGTVSRVRDWPHSSFRRYVRQGEYSQDWGGSDAWYGDEFKNYE